MIALRDILLCKLIFYLLITLTRVLMSTKEYSLLDGQMWLVAIGLKKLIISQWRQKGSIWKVFRVSDLHLL